MSAWQPALDFDAAESAAAGGEALIVDLDGFEGPLHLLLALARAQKVDLLQLSVLRLAEQYENFVQAARKSNFALAADYLVMASWLAYLKSRLLLPQAERASSDEPAPEAVAGALAFRLAKLDAMRTAADALEQRPQLGREVFGRGMAQPDAPAVGEVELTLTELLRAMVGHSVRRQAQRYAPRTPKAYPLEAARDRLREQLPSLDGWTGLRRVAPVEADGAGRASCLASTLAASLELIREGVLDARQAEAFAELLLRRRETLALDAAA